VTNPAHLKFYPAEVPHSIDYPQHNLAKILVDTAQKYLKHAALNFLGYTMNYETLLKSCYRFANAMLRLGIRKGDRVAIMLPNCPQAIIAYYGTLLFGGIGVMTNPLYMPREIEHQMKDSGARVIVTLDPLVARVEKAMSSKPMEFVIATSIKDYLPFPKNLLYPIQAKRDGMAAKVNYDHRILRLVSLLKESSADPVYHEVNAVEDLALIQYTGGTTGVAKGVMLTHYNLLVNTTQAGAWCYKVDRPNQGYLAALPFFHVFGLTVLLNLSVKTGGMLILLPRFQVGAVVKAIHKFKPTLFPGAPTMYISLINYPDVHKYDLSSIEVCVSGAAALPLEVQEKFEKLTGGRLIEGYGLTETSPITHANNIWGVRKTGSIGIPYPDTEARIVDPNSGEPLPNGEIGELVIKGPQVMKGYWNNSTETARTLKDGWFYTGDLGRMDEDGFFYILDRRKDLIIAGGYNIYPREVEEILFEHPDVEEAVVAGMADPYRGETVKAFIVLKDGATVSAAELKAFCKERLAAYKVPQAYEFRDSLPKTLVGKILRRKLIEDEMQKLAEEQRTDGGGNLKSS